ncbi:TetR/AcrR family transcriptional regulator [Actinocatenispora rupis]|uniref:TetR family transcriptional regulator n=1 Tax=Actinocatenispora rupis TaxID=519421 RepID=A0A8J3N926_9ACTN|nr:TetR/AcrR family transcriptional regulator [Actinocatenispora rupis]GID10701.1 TetR family transcriptional regulator [Actinocatenispora rupis]
MGYADGKAVALLWGGRGAPRRGPKPTLTLADISAAGIAVADAEGVAAVTMQRVAESLGVTKMALYRYVPGKSELVALMTDAAIGEPPELTGDGWRPRLAEWARRMFAEFWRHPWALETTIGPRVMGPNELSWLDAAIAALDGTGLDGADAMDAAVTIVGHIRMVAQQGVASPADNAEQAMDAAMVELLRGHEADFPALTAALESASRSGKQGRAFEFGLDRILDGIAHLVGTRG